MNGGYQIFDMQGVNITSEPVKIEGLHEFLEGRKKTVILENLVVNGLKVGSIYCGVINDEPILLKSMEGYNIRVNGEDLVNVV